MGVKTSGVFLTHQKDTRGPLSIRRLGRVEYADGLEIQKELVEERRTGRIGDTLLLLEHPPVITLGVKSRGKPTNIIASPERLAEAGVAVYDTGRGGVRVPQSWRLLYKDGDAWKPVEAASPFGTAPDSWNKVTFKPVTTAALRIELTMQPDVSAGIQEWRVK